LRRRRSTRRHRTFEAARATVSIPREWAVGEATGPKHDLNFAATAARPVEVPYFGQPVVRDVFLNDSARDAIERAKAGDFVALPDSGSPALLHLRDVVEAGWRKHELQGAGHVEAWPEVFEAGRKVIEEHMAGVPGAEVLTGTGWMGADQHERSIDWVQRRPKAGTNFAKFDFAKRLHRDPDSWTNPRTSQRPRSGWVDLAMPDRDRYSYRFINLWLARSAIDPTEQVWSSPLVVLLPREKGTREWAWQTRTLGMDAEAAEDESNFSLANGGLSLGKLIVTAHRATNALYGALTGEERFKQRGESEVFVDGDESFAFPELIPSEEQTFVTGPCIIFDAFDLWHGCGRFADDREWRRALHKVDPRGRKPGHAARCSIELRFRVRVDKTVSAEPWSPFTAAVKAGAFVDHPLRTSEQRYNLTDGTVVAHD